MHNTITYRPLTATDMDQLYHTFIASFTDYQVNMAMDRKAFNKRILYKLNIQWNASFGAFSNDKLVGFVLHTLNTIDGELYAYNGGTGTLPAFRGQNITFHIYQACMGILVSMGVKRAILEVLENNAAAIRVYEKIGFAKNRYLRSYKGTVRNRRPARTNWAIAISTNQDMMKLPPLGEAKTDFMGTLQQLQHNKKHETVIKASDKGQEGILGYLIVNVLTGRVSRIWVDSSSRRRGIGSALMASAGHLVAQKPLVVINVDGEDHGTMAFLESLGLQNQLNQFEMALELSQFAP